MHHRKNKTITNINFNSQKINPKKVIIYCSYTREKTIKSLNFIKTIVDLNFFDYSICVLNGQDKNKFDDFNFDQYIVHDNTEREFGALQVGLNVLVKCKSISGVLFMNDTFGVHEPEAKMVYRKLQRFLNKEKSKDPFGVGCCDSAGNEIFILNNTIMKKWIRGNFIYLNAEALSRMQFDIIQKTTIERYYNNSSSTHQLFSDKLSINLQKHLYKWMGLEDGGAKWYGVNKLNSQDYVMGKINAILIELNITRMMVENNIKIIDLGEDYLVQVIRFIRLQIKRFGKAISFFI